MRRCPECGAQIEDRLNACPNCGYPISKDRQRQNIDKDEIKKQNCHQTNYLKTIIRTIHIVVSLFVNIIVILSLYFAISWWNGNKDKNKTFEENILLMLLPELEYVGEYTICIDNSDDCYALTIDKDGTAILGSIDAHRGVPYVWEISKWGGRKYLTLRAESPVESNLYISEDKVYESEFELRRNSNNYKYVITHKEMQGIY